jgi:hypothetical protein
MKPGIGKTARILGAAVALAAWSAAQNLPEEIRSKVEAKAAQLKALGSDPKVVEAVKAYNAAPPPEATAMTNEKWKTLSVLDPFVRGYTRNPLMVHLKSQLDPAASEAFVSGADGGKVAFLAKTTSWNHKGKEKHQMPMAGKLYYGPVEVDESSGQQQVQVGFPVLDGTKPIGSIVVGLAIARLK